MDDQIRQGTKRRRHRYKKSVPKEGLSPEFSSKADLFKGSPIIGKSKRKSPTSWATKEGLVVLSLILIFIFSIMSIIFRSVWASYIFAFRVLSGFMFTIFIIIAIFGFRLINVC